MWRYLQLLNIISTHDHVLIKRETRYALALAVLSATLVSAEKVTVGLKVLTPPASFTLRSGSLWTIQR